MALLCEEIANSNSSLFVGAPQSGMMAVMDPAMTPGTAANNVIE